VSSASGAAAGHVAFLIPHPYVDALACFREPIALLADQGWQVDLYTTLSPQHPTPFFGRDRVRLLPFEMTRAGTVGLIRRLALRRPRYRWIVTVPQWGLHYAALAGRLAGIPLGCISDELKCDAEAATAGLRLWKARERRAHQRCRWTIALSSERADFIREENRLGADHRIFVVPNATRGPARRVPSHYYHDTLSLTASARILLHSGSLWWPAANELIASTDAWPSDWVVVFQGRLVAPRAAGHEAPHLRFTEQVLPASLLDYATSSAAIGLALYDTSCTNNRLMGTASGKLALYMKNTLPVIATDQSGFGWLEREHCGVCVSSVRDIPAAADRIWRDYEAYVRNVRRYYDASMEFETHFRPVARVMAEA
jgi:hypothetical protein